VPLEFGGTKSHNGSCGGGWNRCNVSNVQGFSNMSVVVVWFLLSLSPSTPLTFGAVQLLLLATRLLVIEVLVTMLVFQSTDFVGILLLTLATSAHIFQLILSQNGIADMR
jgi:hypothetical protein